MCCGLGLLEAVIHAFSRSAHRVFGTQQWFQSTWPSVRCVVCSCAAAHRGYPHACTLAHARVLSRTAHTLCMCALQSQLIGPSSHACLSTFCLHWLNIRTGATLHVPHACAPRSHCHVGQAAAAGECLKVVCECIRIRPSGILEKQWSLRCPACTSFVSAHHARPCNAGKNAPVTIVQGVQRAVGTEAVPQDCLLAKYVI